MDKKIKVFYFGNPHIDEDSLAIRVAEKLKKTLPDIEFINIKDTFELMDIDLTSSIILDVVHSLKEVSLLRSDDIKSSGASTTHDFDLGFFLKLTNQKAKIIGLPQQYDENRAAEKVRELITTSHPS
jgi:Ni,Fe-hydrogenase maturation factor